VTPTRIACYSNGAPKWEATESRINHIGVAHAQEAPMSTTLAQTRPATLSTISPDFAGVCLFSLLGLTLSAAVLSYVSNETISLMFSSIG
jgi:hypothetical protein